MNPGRPSKHRGRPDAKRELAALLGQLDHRAAGAVLTILEMVADSDRRRARRLIEAIATLIALAPRRVAGQGIALAPRRVVGARIALAPRRAVGQGPA